LGRHTETTAFDYRSDPTGRVVPLDAHIRRANPRTAKTDGSRILRRGYSYRNQPDGQGRADEGLVFGCFQQDLDRGLVTVQRRSAGEALSKYILPFGGGYYYVLPGVDDTAQGDFLGRGLLDAASGSARFSRVARRCLSAPALCPPL
jgi:deferrochelatase/peroxidase EfeB